MLSADLVPSVSSGVRETEDVLIAKLHVDPDSIVSSQLEWMVARSSRRMVDRAMEDLGVVGWFGGGTKIGEMIEVEPKAVT